MLAHVPFHAHVPKRVMRATRVIRVRAGDEGSFHAHVPIRMIRVMKVKRVSRVTRVIRVISVIRVMGVISVRAINYCHAHVPGHT